MKEHKKTTKVVWPPEDEINTPLLKKGKGDKPFKIEMYSRWSWNTSEKKWHTYKTYETKRGMDQAFETLKRETEDYIKRFNSPVHRYRKVENGVPGEETRTH